MRLGIILVLVAVAILANLIAPPPGAAAQIERKIYRVRQGDTLWSLAGRHRTTPQILARMNRLKVGATLSLGQRLEIPVTITRPIAPASRRARVKGAPAGSRTVTTLYRLRAGDTLWTLARRQKTTPEHLAALNGISAGAILSIGKSLSVPAPARAPAPPAPPRRTPAAIGNVTAGVAESLRKAAPSVPVDASPPAAVTDPGSATPVAGRQAPAVRPRPAVLPSRGARWASTIVNLSTRQLGVPYRWGGITPDGFDCSGFAVYIFQRTGITLPRTTYDMFEAGTPVPHDQLQPGDIVFFQTLQPGPSHNGIYLGNGRFIHSSSGAKRVTITPMNHRYYGPRYLGARRF